MCIGSLAASHMPKHELSRIKPYIKKLMERGVDPERVGVPLSEDQLLLRGITREILSHAPAGPGVRMAEVSFAGSPPSSPPPFSAAQKSTINRKHEEIHHVRMAVLAGAMRRFEILSTNEDYLLKTTSSPA